MGQKGTTFKAPNGPYTLNSTLGHAVMRFNVNLGNFTAATTTVYYGRPGFPTDYQCAHTPKIISGSSSDQVWEW